MSARSACSSLLARAAVRSPRVLFVSARCAGAFTATPARWMSASAGAGPSGAGAGAGAAGEEAGQKKGGEGEKGRSEEDFSEYDVEEPFVARASRFVWTTIKFSAGVAFLGGLVYAGYTIVTTLLPVGDSPNAIMRKATDVLMHDPDVHAYYGECKTYGLDPGGRAEGRRYFVPEYKYEDPLTGEKYHRVKFNLEGERNRKAWVYAEVHSSTGDFRYLLVVAKDGSRVVSVTDRRPPQMSREERLSRATSLIQDAGWTFYVDNDVDQGAQQRVLGDYWLKVKCVRCQDNQERCTEAGVPAGSCPAWQTGSGSGSALTKGVQSLDSLEKMVLPLARPKERGFFW